MRLEFVHLFHARNETIPQSRARLDKAASSVRITKNLSKNIDSCVQPGAETYMQPGPQMLRELRTCDECSRPLKQELENLKRLPLQMYPYSPIA